MRILRLIITLALLVGLAGCSGVRKATRSPETDALLQAARGGHDQVVRLLKQAGAAE